MKPIAKILTLAAAALMACSCGSDTAPVGGGVLGDLVRPMDGRSRRATSTRADENGVPVDHNSDNSRVLAGDTKVVLEADGPGVVTHMWFTFLDKGRHPWAVNGSATHQEMLLRVYYDGHEAPDIEVPFGDFFANCFGERSEVISLPVVVEDADSYNCFWPMPFRKSIRIEIANQSPDKNVNLLYYNIDWIEKKRLPRDTPYFYAMYRQEYPAVSGKDYVVLETEGKGHYVGTVMAVRQRSPQWFGEGDEKIYIDGEEVASIWGTGTEDYFLSAWGLASNVNTPYFGTVYYTHGTIGGQTSAYRWHLADPIVFNKSIKVTFEHTGWMSPDENKERRTFSMNERQDDISTVAFWYQTGTPTFERGVPPAEERVLPSIDLEFPAVAALETGGCKGGTGFRQDNLDHYMGGQLTFVPGGSAASVEIPFTVGKKEPRRLVLAVTEAPDYGIWQAYLNGVKVGGPINLYGERVRAWEHHLLDFWPDPGDYVLTLRPVGRDRNSTGDGLGIESVRLRERRPRVAGYGFDRDNDWRTDPKFYQ